METLSLAQRIQGIMDHYQIRSNKEFSRMTGINYEVVKTFLDGRKKQIGSEYGEKILEAFPLVRPHYIYAGVGKMLWPVENYIQFLEENLLRAQNKFAEISEVLNLMQYKGLEFVNEIQALKDDLKAATA